MTRLLSIALLLLVASPVSAADKKKPLMEIGATGQLFRDKNKKIRMEMGLAKPSNVTGTVEEALTAAGKTKNDVTEKEAEAKFELREAEDLEGRGAGRDEAGPDGHGARDWRARGGEAGGRDRAG